MHWLKINQKYWNYIIFFSSFIYFCNKILCCIYSRYGTSYQQYSYFFHIYEAEAFLIAFIKAGRTGFVSCNKRLWWNGIQLTEFTVMFMKRTTFWLYYHINDLFSIGKYNLIFIKYQITLSLIFEEDEQYPYSLMTGINSVLVFWITDVFAGFC